MQCSFWFTMAWRKRLLLKLAMVPLWVILILGFVINSAAQVDNNPFRHLVVLHPKYQVEWVANHSAKRVTFEVTAKTRGYVGFGLNHRGLMESADIVIGGVYPNGTSYFSDRHSTGRSIPVEDDSQDYTLEETWENGTHTFLRFSRPFETCDTKDIQLHEHGNVTYMIFAFGESDTDISYHFQNRGSQLAYILDADLRPRGIEEAPPFGNFADGRIVPVGEDWKVWTLSTTQLIPAQDTSYMCTFHKAPVHDNKIHAVGFRIVTDRPSDISYIHHYAIHRCRSPPGVDGNSLFAHFVGQPAEFCFLLNLPIDQSRIPFQYCQEFVHVWGAGGTSSFVPHHIGIPMSETPDEYYMLQVHYNLEAVRPGILMKTAVEVFYTEQLRENDGGMMFVGTNLPGSPSILIPPSSIDHINYGICSAGCTERMLPKSGINIYGVLLHTHEAGRKVRLQQIRNQKHLPSILYNDNHIYNYQQIRMMSPERTVLPGDTLITRCVYDSTNKNGSATMGGLSSGRSEMCASFLWYYPYISSNVFSICASDIRAEPYRAYVGILNSTWSNEFRENIVFEPRKNAGLLETEVANRLEWTTDKRRTLQLMQRNLPQVSICPSLQVTDPTVVHLSNPEFEFESIPPESLEPYQPPDVCLKSQG